MYIGIPYTFTLKEALHQFTHHIVLKLIASKYLVQSEDVNSYRFRLVGKQKVSR